MRQSCYDLKMYDQDLLDLALGKLAGSDALVWGTVLHDGQSLQIFDKKYGDDHTFLRPSCSVGL